MMIFSIIWWYFSLYDDTFSLYDDTFSLYDDTSSLYDDTCLYDDTFPLYNDTFSLYDGTSSLYDDTFSTSIVAFPSPIPMIPVIKKMAQKMKEILEELNLHALIPQFEREDRSKCFSKS